VYAKLAKEAPLSVGNGAFFFTADFTGLQTFSAEYATGEEAFPLCTMSEWGWHSYTGAPQDDSLLRFTPFDTWGRDVVYAVDETGQETGFRGLRQNAHKFHLGKIAFELEGADISLDNTKSLKQYLNIWDGVFMFEREMDGTRYRATASGASVNASFREDAHSAIFTPRPAPCYAQ
jgi:hypothetical protein